MKPAVLQNALPLFAKCMSRSAIAAVVASAFAFEPTFGSAQEVNSAGRPFPQIQLPARARGAEIISALGDRLPEVAEFYMESPQDFRAIVTRDRSICADRMGRLHYVCDALPREGATAGTAGTTVEAGPFPASQTFLLHSRPGATRKIYLDFTGHTTSGTFWNSSYTAGADFVTPPYDIDGNPSSFSATELDNIQFIWQRVAEDYAPFEVDVTTEDPGVEGLRKTSSSDVNYGVRVCIGGSSYDWFGAGAGGVTYLGCFDWSTDTPAFVFPAQLGNGAEKYVAEAISHEVGHAFNLHHDGTTTGTEYYSGHGNWAPIMGVGYYKDVVQWSKGEYPNANNTEDDLAKISGYVGYRADDHGGSIGAATPLTGPSVFATGVIERTADADVFSFNTGPGNISFTVVGAARSPNLDAQLALYDGSGTLILWSNAPGLAGSLSANVASGTYYLLVDGVGTGDPTTGYSDYASLGQFTLTGTIQSATGSPPIAAASGTPTVGTAPLVVNFSSAGSYDPDGSIAAYDWNFGDGGTSTAANPSHTYNAAGSYTATLVVRDNSGLTANASVTINVAVAANQTPVAVAGASLTSGIAPLAVNFSSAGSYDPDGSIASYSWTFGDGGTSTVANPSHSYSSAGTFTATLVVTDNLGAKATNSVVITVLTNPGNVVFVGNIAMSLVTVASGGSARAVVTIRDASGNVRPGASVSGTWSGLASGSVSGTTDSSGNVTFTTRKTRRSGTFTFTVNGVSASGYTYDPSRNVETTDSIFNP